MIVDIYLLRMRIYIYMRANLEIIKEKGLHLNLNSMLSQLKNVNS